MQSTEQDKAKFWQGHISEWKKSSVGIQEYCERHGISKHTFYYWRKKMRSSSGRSSNLPSAFVPVMTQKISPSRSADLSDPKWLGEFAAALIRGLR